MSESNPNEQAGKPSAPLLGSAPQNHPVLKAIELARLQVEVCGGAVAMMLRAQEECERWRLVAETHKLTWTTQQPETEGFYWTRLKGRKYAVWMAHVEWCPRTERLHALTTGGGDNEEFDQYEWAGPLQPPLDSPNTQAEAQPPGNAANPKPQTL